MKKKPTSKYLSHSICKWFFCENVNLPHTYDHDHKNNSFITWKLSNFSNGSQIWFKSCEMTCEIIIMNFMKVKNHFNHFWNIFVSFSTLWYVLFSYKYTAIHHNIKRKWFIFCSILFFGVMLYHNMQKHCENLL